MKILLFLLSFISFSASSATYFIEMKKDFHLKDLSRIKRLSGSKKIEKVLDINDEYFKRLYFLDSKKTNLELLLKSDKSIALVETDIKPETFEVKINPQSEMFVDDMIWPQQWNLMNQGQISVTRTLQGVPQRIKGKNIDDINWKTVIDEVEGNLQKTPVVAVLDTGVDVDHPELKDAIARNLEECNENGSVPPKEEQVEREGDIYPYDCHGWNFAAESQEEFPYPYDQVKHGTHLAGIIAAKRNNGKGISGVSDKIKILPVKVLSTKDGTQDVRKLMIPSPARRIMSGVLYAVRKKVDVINFSLGWPKSMNKKYLKNIVHFAIKQGVTVVAAAGNDNSSLGIYPCHYYDVICVGSSDINGQVSPFSNYGGQVDLLAPGNQIVSTIPTVQIPIKLNLQGYDNLSGTSQAAPHVAATVALMKGVDPEIDLDEIRRRLFLSAGESPDLSKSSQGVLNFAGSFAEKSGPSVFPVFKELSSAVVNHTNGLFKFNVFLKNYGDQADTTKISIQSNSKGIVIREFPKEVKGIVKGKNIPMQVVGQVQNFSADNEFSFTVSLNTNGQKKEFTHYMTLGVGATLVPGLNFGFKFAGKAKPLVYEIVEDGEKTGVFDRNLTMMDEVFSDGQLPSYFIVRNKIEGNKPGISLSVFHFDGKGYLEVKNPLEIPKAAKLVRVLKGDFNYDGKKDLFIKTFTCVKECDGEFNEILSDNFRMVHSYRTLDLQPLFGEYSDLVYDPENTSVSVRAKTARFYKSSLPNGQHIALPYFINNGRFKKNMKPELLKIAAEKKIEGTNFEGSDIFNNFVGKDRSIQRRIYRVSYDKELNALVSQTFVNRDLQNQVRLKLKYKMNKRFAASNSYVSIIQLLKQSKVDYYENKVSALGAVGLGGYQYNFFLDINGNDLVIRDGSNLEEMLIGNLHYPFFDLNSNQIKREDAFVNFVSSDSAVVTGLEDKSETESFSYFVEDINDLVVEFISLFKQGNTLKSYFEQVDSIKEVSFDGEEVTTRSNKIKKFSFLPGYVYSELFEPVVVRKIDRESKTSTLEPAIYSDNTKISMNHVYLKTRVGDKFVSPIRNSYFMPQYCQSESPFKGKDGHYLFAFVCLEKERGFRIRFIEMLK